MAGTSLRGKAGAGQSKIAPLERSHRHRVGQKAHVWCEEAEQMVDPWGWLHQPGFRGRRQGHGEALWQVMARRNMWHFTLRKRFRRGFKAFIWGFISILTAGALLNVITWCVNTEFCCVHLQKHGLVGLVKKGLGTSPPPGAEQMRPAQGCAQASLESPQRPGDSPAFLSNPLPRLSILMETYLPCLLLGISHIQACDPSQGASSAALGLPAAMSSLCCRIHTAYRPTWVSQHQF